jgi:hypothetical protein
MKKGDTINNRAMHDNTNNGIVQASIVAVRNPFSATTTERE